MLSLPSTPTRPAHVAGDVENITSQGGECKGDEAPGQTLLPKPLQAEVAPATLTKPHFCGVQILGYAALNITWTEENKDKFVRQWTRDCKNEPKLLVFDVDGKPLESPADAKGAMNVIDALRVCTAKSSASASRHAKPEELIKLGIDRRNIYLIHFDGDTGVRC